MNVYFIQAGEDGPVKIGKSKNVLGRLNDMRTNSPYPLKLLGVIVGDHEDEMHERFDHLRLQGEWFRDDEELLEFVATLPSADKTSLEAAYRKPRERRRWRHRTTEAEMRAIWTDPAILTNKIAAERIGIPVRTIYWMLGPSGRPTGFPWKDGKLGRSA